LSLPTVKCLAEAGTRSFMPHISQSISRVLIADDHAILRDGLRLILKDEGYQVVGEASDGLEAVRLSKMLQPGFVVLDISMPLLNGIDAAREIHNVSPSTKIILLTMYTDDRYVLAGLRAGIAAYVLKSKAGSNLIQAIEAARKGEIYLSPGISRTVVDAYLAKADMPTDPLTLREREILQLIAEGRNVKEIANMLGISAKTAESHRTNIMKKTNIHEIAGLVRYAIRLGLVSSEYKGFVEK
jgi:DNA-binding NarL/FixJ family response regulator